VDITIETKVAAGIAAVWDAWNNPEDIKQWNAASDDWHTPASEVDLREGGRFSSRMEARDGSGGFSFGGTYTRIVQHERIEYTLDGNRRVTVEFKQERDGVRVIETFEAEGENDPEFQRQGWQSILNRFARHVEGRRPLIARIWRGRTRRETADAYEAYLKENGIPPLQKVARGIQLFRADGEEETWFTTISYWTDIESMTAFTKGEPTKVHHLERDAELLIELPARIEIHRILIDDRNLR
jgi:uncharacterized protein YndB with AHSA1/START domain